MNDLRSLQTFPSIFKLFAYRQESAIVMDMLWSKSESILRILDRARTRTKPLEPTFCALAFDGGGCNLTYPCLPDLPVVETELV